MNVQEMGRALTAMKSTLTQWAPKEITPEICNAWLMVLADYSDAQISAAFRTALSELTEFPAPATIKRLCQGSNRTDEEIGQEVASRIEGALSRVGSYVIESEPDRRQAKTSELHGIVGDIGMEVIRMTGGWEKLCAMETKELIAYRKQWRELATVVSKNFFSSGANLPPALPSSGERQQHPALQAALKLAVGSP